MPTLLLDDEDRQRFTGCRIVLDRNGYAVFACGRKRRCGHYGLVHRVVLNVVTGEAVHHRNRDRLDNRRANLEVLSIAAHHQRHSEEERARLARRWRARHPEEG